MANHNLDAFYVLSLEFEGGGQDTLCRDEEELRNVSREFRTYARKNHIRGHLITHKYFKVYYDESIFDNNGSEFFDNYFDAEKNVVSEECLFY